MCLVAAQEAKPEVIMTPEREEAALKIQQRARGMHDRKKVAEQKARGELPGQMRTASASNFTPEQQEAAKKIQMRARGMNDRKRVTMLKEQGELPGQKRTTPSSGAPEVAVQMTYEQEQAALRIQQRARGMNDRKKVALLKEKGELPGQKRGQVSPDTSSSRCHIFTFSRTRFRTDTFPRSVRTSFPRCL